MYKLIDKLQHSFPDFNQPMELHMNPLNIYSKKTGVNREDTVACGDGFNDMSMIKYAGVGVAMANTQEAADMVTKRTNDGDEKCNED